jgi:hypothetical protein
MRVCMKAYETDHSHHSTRSTRGEQPFVLTLTMLQDKGWAYTSFTLSHTFLPDFLLETRLAPQKKAFFHQN